MAVLKKRALAEFSQVVQQETIQAPRKKLRLVHKVKLQDPPLSFQGAGTNDDIMQILLRFEGILPIDADHIDQCLRLLLEQYHACKDTAVRAKIASLCGLLSKTPNVDVTRIINDLINLLKSEESHKVVAQLSTALQICGQTMPLNKKLHEQIVGIAIKNLSNCNHLVKARSLMVIGSLGSPADKETASEKTKSSSSLQSILGEFTQDADSRVRTAAFDAMLNWHQRGITIEPEIYDKASQALADDYESVRSVATKLIWVISHIYPERKIEVVESEEGNRLVDDAFAKICDMLNDSCVSVRAEAAALLGSLHGVSQKFLDQTLDKNLLSHMKRRVTNLDNLKGKLAGNRGGFSSGRKWADDGVKNEEENSITLMNMGACGAFVHGLEDEFLEVRMPAIDSMCELATRSESFALQCVDSLVDMFNDEIEGVQLNAINSLRKISHVIVLRDDQLEIIMGCIKAFSFEVREAFRALLGSVKFANKDCLKTCVFGLLDLLKRYPHDRKDLWKCMTKMGKNNQAFVLSLAPDLLSSHPYFEAVEPDVEDPAYVSVLLLVFNAAVGCPTMAQLFPDHAVRHYNYLKDSLPSLVPPLQIETIMHSGVLKCLGSPPRSTNPNTFLNHTMDRLQSMEQLDSSGRVQLIKMCIKDLERISNLDDALAPNASLTSLFLECQLCLCKVMTQDAHRISSFVSQTQANMGAALGKVVSHTYKMQYQYMGLAIGDLSQILQLRIFAQSAQLLQLLRNNASGIKQSCIQYLQLLNNFERFLNSNNLEPNTTTRALLSSMQKLETCDPVVYHSVLSDSVAGYKPHVFRLHNSVKMAKAEIIEPVPSDKTITFMTGLAAAVDMIVSLDDIENTDPLHIQVRYPDQQIHTFVPKSSDLKQLSECRHRLITTVLLSHQQWSEACQVEIGVVLCYRKEKDFSEEKAMGKNKSLEYIQLCKPVKLSVAPKPLKK